MRGRPLTEEHTQKIYDQEYEEVVGRVENYVDLTNESPSFSVILTCIVKPDIILPSKLFRERRGFPEVPPGHGEAPREYEMDEARSLVDLDWSERTPIFHPDDIDRDPHFNQYPYQEVEDYDEEGIETNARPSGGASDAPMGPPMHTRHPQRLPATYSSRLAETLGSPRSTHTDMDTAMELENLSMAPGGPDVCHVAPRASAPEDLAEKVVRGVAAAATKILENLTRALPAEGKSCPPVDESADATIRERFLRQRATTPSSGQAASGRVSAFERLGQQAPVSQEDQWMPWPEMTPRKIERGQQPNKEPEPQQAGSQKRRSQSHPRDEADPKKGRTEGEGKPAKIQVSIDWTTTGIQKPVAKVDSRQSSSKTDTSGANRQQSRQRESQKQESRWSGKETRSAQAPPGNPEKIELWYKPYRWIETRLRCLDPAGFLEEIHSLRFFRENAKDFALQIIAIANWGWKYLEVGLSYPVPTFLDFQFTPVPDSHQGGSQVPVRPSQVRAPVGDVRDKSREAWK